jgi:hypothetical protein
MAVGQRPDTNLLEKNPVKAIVLTFGNALAEPRLVNLPPQTKSKLMKPTNVLLLAAGLSISVARAAPVITCPDPVTVSCNTTSTLSLAVIDPQGSDLGVIWSVNGLPMQTNSIAGAQSILGTNITFAAIFPFGTNTIDVVAADTAANSASCSTTVTVIDTNPPVITSVHAAPEMIWPPNHKMKSISVAATVTDDCSATSWKIISISSSEAELGHGSGHTSPDFVIIGDHAAKVRAERSGNGSGRVYTITIQAVDAAGNISEPATTTVTVPHDKGHKPAKPPKPAKPAKPHGKG